MNTENLVGKKMSYNGILGKVIEFDGGIVYFSTPHGTVLKMGYYFYFTFAQELTPEESKQLEIYENQVKEQGEIPYEQTSIK